METWRRPAERWAIPLRTDWLSRDGTTSVGVSQNCVRENLQASWSVAARSSHVGRLWRWPIRGIWFSTRSAPAVIAGAWTMPSNGARSASFGWRGWTGGIERSLTLVRTGLFPPIPPIARLGTILGSRQRREVSAILPRASRTGVVRTAMGWACPIFGSPTRPGCPSARRPSLPVPASRSTAPKLS